MQILMHFLKKLVSRRCASLQTRCSAPSDLKHTVTPFEAGKDVFGRHGSGRDDLSTNRKTILAEILQVRRPR